MYGSVEMLLKFYAENFHFKFTRQKSRRKSIPAHTTASFKLKISHWRSRHFTHAAANDRIHSALLEIINYKFLKIFRVEVFTRIWKANETKTYNSLC